jgi:RecA/RadA recombinase
MAKKKPASDDPTQDQNPTTNPNDDKPHDFLSGLAKRIGVTVVPYSERIHTNKTRYYDTGSYTLNALISGSLLVGGIPSDSIIGLAGETGTGKTYVCLSVCEHFLRNYDNGVVVYFDTEHAVKEHHVEGRYLPKTRFSHTEVNTLEEFRMIAVKILNDYMNLEEDKRPPLMFVLDSLGNISTLKEIEESEKNLDKLAKDMTKAQLVRSVFRVLAIKLGQANVPLIVTNHVGVKIGGFTRPGMPPPKVMSGGEGLKYAADTILFLGKSAIYDKAIKTYTGNKLTAKLYKSRHTIENLTANTLLDYRTGMDRYFGLFDIAKALGVVEKSGSGFKFPGGKQFFTKDIEADPAHYYTDDVLAAIEEKVATAFRYGQGVPLSLTEDAPPDEE